MSDIAIAHDQLYVKGGAEHVAFEMARALDAPIYCAKLNEDIVPDDVEAHCIVDSRVGKWAMDSHYLAQDLYQMQRWQNVQELYEYDTVVINKTNPGWFVPKPRQTTIWYVHSTPRGQYDQFHKHGGTALSRILKTPMRPLYRPNIAYADAFATNSEEVQRRMERYWDIPRGESTVIYPPVPTETFGSSVASSGDYYFTFGRLVDHKRVGDIVKAFTALGPHYQLVVGGDGPQRDALECLAGENVRFVGFMDEEEKRRRLSECTAFVFAAEQEDFGMTPIEAMASGTPVIGVDEGFTTHQIQNGRNGYLWPREQARLRETIQHLETVGVEWAPERIEEFADRFNADRFRQEFRELVASTEERAAVDVEWESRQEHEGIRAAAVTADGGAQAVAKVPQNTSERGRVPVDKYEKLNLGSGRDYRNGWLNVDINPKYNPDVVLDIDEPLPDEWESGFDHVVASHVIEHLENREQALNEIARVLTDGGTLRLYVPLGLNARTDDTHKTEWTYDTPLQYAQNWRERTDDYQFDPSPPLRIISRDVEMHQHGPLAWMSPLLRRMASQRPGVWLSGWPCSSGELSVLYRRLER